MNKSHIAASFIFGAILGSVGSWMFAKKKYEILAQEEIESVKRVFTYKKETPEKDHDDHDSEEKIDINEYARSISREGYTNYSQFDSEYPDSYVDYKTNLITKNKENPYVIPPEQFGEFEDYAKITLYFFSDHILTDEDYDLVEDVENVVGFDSLNHFGEYEEDSVYVRNDRLKSDFEILLDQRKRSDVVKSRPHAPEV